MSETGACLKLTNNLSAARTTPKRSRHVTEVRQETTFMGKFAEFGPLSCSEQYIVNCTKAKKFRSLITASCTAKIKRSQC